MLSKTTVAESCSFTYGRLIGTEQTPLVERSDDGHVAVLRLDDPERRNVLSRRLVGDALAQLRTATAGGARAIVLAARGPVFSAGADASEIRADGNGPPVLDPPTPLDLFEAIDRLDRPVVAAVEGRAFGGGVELTLCCDAVVAASTVTFALPEVGLGVIPNTGLVVLRELIGSRRTLDLVLGRRRLDAEEAATLGIVDTIVEPGTAESTAVATAAAMVEGAPPGAVATARRAAHGDVEARWLEIRALMDRIEWREAMEGMTALLERRTPDYGPLWEQARPSTPTGAT